MIIKPRASGAFFLICITERVITIKNINVWHQNLTQMKFIENKE